MKTRLFVLTLTLSLLCGCGGTAESDGSLRVAERHKIVRVMGRGYWSLLFAWCLTDPACKESGGELLTKAPGLSCVPFFRDCALVYRGDVKPPDPESGRATYRTLGEYYATNGRWSQLEASAKPTRPMFLTMRGKRGATTFLGDVDLDYVDYAAWKARHPNFLAVRAASEWDHDLQLAYWMTNVHSNRWSHSRKSLDELSAFLSPWPTDRYGRTALMRRVFERKMELNYGDRAHCSAMRASVCVDHLAGAWGAAVLELETTNTTRPPKEYRWNVQPMFTRGAARQFGVPWVWYVAQFYNGYRKDGSWMNDSAASCLWAGPDGKTHPERGISPSLNRRAYFFAYLSGANFVEQEGWISAFLEGDPKSSDVRLTDRGRAFGEFHDFTVAHPDRGTPYTPVAVLVPFDQGYPAAGGHSWQTFDYTAGDQTVDAVFFTIDPGFDRDAAMRVGREGNLHNSRYAMMYDVVCPDAPQPAETILDVLRSYRAVLVVGDYRDRSFERVLADYEKSGGHVVRIEPRDLPLVGDGAKTVSDIQTGVRTFPSVAGILDRLQRDYFPVRVSGDCLYGLNVRDDGSVWLWCINNCGVSKFADQFATVDSTAAVTIEVSPGWWCPRTAKELLTGRELCVDGGAFSFTIPAGDLAVFEMTR